jgi:hypothetical protein
MLAGLGAALLLGAVVCGGLVLAVRAGTDLGTDGLTLTGAVAGAVACVLTFLVAGWVAGRMARYAGARNGVLSAVWLLVALGVAAAVGVWIGDSFEPFGDVTRPDWVPGDPAVSGAVAGAALAAVCLVVAVAGGTAGGRYHRRADAAVVDEVRGERAERAVDLRESAAAPDRVRDSDRGRDGDRALAER